MQNSGFKMQGSRFRIQDAELHYARVKTLAPIGDAGFKIRDAELAPSHRGFRMQDARFILLVYLIQVQSYHRRSGCA
jgi:hypothetical protein